MHPLTACDVKSFSSNLIPVSSNKTMTDERQGKNKGIAISSFDADAEKQSRQAIDRKVLE